MDGRGNKSIDIAIRILWLGQRISQGPPRLAFSEESSTTFLCTHLINKIARMTAEGVGGVISMMTPFNQDCHLIIIVECSRNILFSLTTQFSSISQVHRSWLVIRNRKYTHY